VGVAAVLSGKVPADGRPTAVVLTGSNLDPETLEGALHPA